MEKEWLFVGEKRGRFILFLMTGYDGSSDGNLISMQFSA